MNVEIAKLVKSKDDRVRWFGATALQFVGNETTAKTLLEILKDKNPEVRLAAITSLENAANDACIESLVSSLKTIMRTGNTVYDSETAAKIIMTIGNVGTAKAKKSLTDLETNVRDRGVKERIRIAIDRITANPKD